MDKNLVDELIGYLVNQPKTPQRDSLIARVVEVGLKNSPKEIHPTHRVRERPEDSGYACYRG